MIELLYFLRKRIEAHQKAIDDIKAEIKDRVDFYSKSSEDVAFGLTLALKIIEEQEELIERLTQEE